MNESQERLLVELKELKDLVQQWLVYAEAKLSAFLAISGLLVYNFFKVFSVDEIRNELLLLIGLGALLFAFLVILIGLMPRIRYLPNIALRASQKDDERSRFNVFSTYNLSNHSPRELLRILKKHMGLEALTKPLEIELDYAELIKSTARIIMFKYKVFHIALLFLVSALISIGSHLFGLG